jgi:hypothetical protein
MITREEPTPYSRTPTDLFVKGKTRYYIDSNEVDEQTFELSVINHRVTTCWNVIEGEYHE